MLEQKVQLSDQEMKTYHIQGFSCANCANKFERNVKRIPGVEDAKVNFIASKISVLGDATIEELEKAGAFEQLNVTLEEGNPNGAQTNTAENPFYKKYARILYSTSFLAFGYSFYLINGEENLLTILLFLASILVSGLSLLKIGLQNLLRFEFDLKTLMTVAVIGGALIGEWGEVAVVVILFAISEELERFSMDRARHSIRSLMEIAPKEALLIRHGQETLLHVNDIVVGDIMLVKPGEKIAMDGVVVNGHSTVNQAAITGESVPVKKTVEDNVFAGTLNENGFLEVKVTKLVTDTTLANIIYLVEKAQGERAPLQAFVDKFAKYYTPMIMVIAALVALVPPLLFGSSWETWIYLGLAVLVVGCPCALVISTPISIVSAIGNAAKKGVLIKGGVYLEKMGALQAMAFDKTGTLTKGIPVVTDLIVWNYQISSRELLAMITALESRSQHPLASAIMNQAKKEKISVSDLRVEDFTSLTGLGIKGVINGVTYYIGNTKLFQHVLSTHFDQELEKTVNSLQLQGKTTMMVGTKNEILGVMAVADEVRESSKEVIQQLHKLGIRKTIMLTGDNKRTANAIGKQVGVSEIQADLMPTDKLDRVKALRDAYDHVSMVGDGVNDAPALAASTVGIAMGRVGTDAALETADIVLMGDDLRKLPFTIKLSRKALKIIKANIVFALSIKFIALLLVIPGWLTLWIAILSDMGATIIVTLNGLRLMRVKEKTTI